MIECLNTKNDHNVKWINLYFFYRCNDFSFFLLKTYIFSKKNWIFLTYITILNICIFFVAMPSTETDLENLKGKFLPLVSIIPGNQPEQVKEHLSYWVETMEEGLKKGVWQEYWNDPQHHFRYSLVYWLQLAFGMPETWTEGLTLLEQLEEIETYAKASSDSN